MRIILIALACSLAPTLVFADMLDRYQDAVTTQAVRMHDFMVGRVPEMADVLPDTAWTPEMEAVATCTLDGLNAARGGDGVEAYVAALEAWSIIEIRSLGTMADGMDPILGDDLALTLSQDCGGMELAAKQMQQSGMMEMMSRPDVMKRLLAE